jgi:transposase
VVVRLYDVADNRNLLQVSEEQREELERWAQSRTLPAGDVARARLILALADGLSYREIERKLGASAPTVSLWKSRFEQSGVDGLQGQHKGSRPRTATPAIQARIIRRVQQKPTDGSTHWSCRKLASELRLSKSTVQRVLAQAKLKPHRLDRYMASNDPQFEEKAADIIGLYMNPPQHAAVFCVDEKSAIQALDRLDPVLPLSPGRAERHGFEYYRHGTLSLYAALDVKTGKVEGKTARRHTSAEFVDFLTVLLSKAQWAKEIHIVLDNLSAHKTQAVRDFLEANPKVRFHFTPTYSSWLNQVEIWFGKIERDVIARGIFKSVTDLSRKLMKYIRAYAKSAKPIRWTYTDPKRRIRAKEVTGTVH